MQQCLLCHTVNRLSVAATNPQNEIFWKCDNCGFIFRAPEFHLPLKEEQARYRMHQNHVDDPEYQKFLRPVIDAVLKNHSAEQTGLDFGSGPASVIAHLLKREKFDVEVFDPLFFPDREVLKKQYDYVTCTEVVEHFTDAAESFTQLTGLLKPKANLYIKTSLTDDVRDFSQWYYQRDPTHVSFYNKKSLEYVGRKLCLSSVQFYKDFIVMAN